jgi:hypothetical protein
MYAPEPVDVARIRAPVVYASPLCVVKTFDPDAAMVSDVADVAA